MNSDGDGKMLENDEHCKTYKSVEKKIRKHQREWSFSIIGTGLGAGVLYLAVNGGRSGFILFILSVIISYPIAYLAQKYIMVLILNSKNSQSLSSTVKSYTGKFTSMTFTYIYGIAVFLSILAFASGINSMIGNFIMRLGITESNLSFNPLFSLILINLLTVLMMFGEKLLISILEKLTLFLLLALFAVSILLIPNWNFSTFIQIDFRITDIFSHIFLLIPLLTFSVVLVPPLAPMSDFFKSEYPGVNSEKLNKICYRSYKFGFWGLAVFVIIFSASCLLAMSPESLDYAVKNNISALAALNINSQCSYTSFLRTSGIVITMLALLTSYYGCALGFVETVASNCNWKDMPYEKKKKASSVLLGILIWFFVTFNLSVINVIGMFITPCVGYIYYILPSFIIRKRPELAKYRNWINFVVIALGLFIVVSFFIGIALKN